MICNNDGCDHVAVVQLVGPVDLCKPCFDERCADESKPAMGSMFGPTTLEIRWDPDMGQTVPDNLAMDCVQAKIKEFTDGNMDMTHIVGSDILLICYRVAVKRGYIEPYHVFIRDPKGDIHQIDKDGNLESLPCNNDHSINLLLEIF